MFDSVKVHIILKTLMYGQKQIFQCLAVALVLAIFSFHRSAIRRNKEIKRIQIRKFDQNQFKNAQINIESFQRNPTENLTGYCFKLPFSSNIYANHCPNIVCRPICFDRLGTWLQKQYAANCCVPKSVTAIQDVRVKENIQNQKRRQLPTTRKETLMEFIDNFLSTRQLNRLCKPIY